MIKRKWNKDLAVQVGTNMFLHHFTLLFHPVVVQTPSLIVHYNRSVSLWPTLWSHSVAAGRQHLDSSCDIGFLLHLLQCHKVIGSHYDRVALLRLWISPKNISLIYLKGILVKTIKLPCHRSFSLSVSSWSPQFTLLFPSLASHPHCVFRSFKSPILLNLRMVANYNWNIKGK